MSRFYGFGLGGMLMLAACQPFVNSRGNCVASEYIDSFVPGKTTMQEVLEKCGTPSLHRDNLTWIYIGARSEVTAFKGVEMKDKHVIKLTFGPDKVLINIEKICPPDTETDLSDDRISGLLTESEAAESAKSFKHE